MKRKLLSILTTCILAISLTACGGQEESTNTVENTSEAIESLTETSSASEESSEEIIAESSETEESSAEVLASEEPSAEAPAIQSTTVLGGLILDLPEGFTKSKTESTDTIEYFHGPNYPNEMANINVNTVDNDGSLGTTTKDVLIQSVEQQLEAVYQVDLTLNVLGYETYEIDGHQALYYGFKYDITEDVALTQQQCIVETKDKLIFVTFTHTSDEDYADAFDACMDSFRFE